MKKILFTYYVSVAEALTWQLYKKSLHWELTDAAECAAICADIKGENGEKFSDVECDTEIKVDGDRFAVSFVVPEKEPAEAK